jgi:hypothetical protein
MDIERPDLLRQKRRLRLSIGAAILLCVMGTIALLGSGGMAPPAVERESLWIERVQQAEMRREARARGILAPREIRWVTTATAATVSRILVRPAPIGGRRAGPRYARWQQPSRR